MQNSVTVIAPVNIAVIKYCKYLQIKLRSAKFINYWIYGLGGKRNESLILPINDSLSVTLSTADVSIKLIDILFFSLIFASSSHVNLHIHEFIIH